METSAASGGRLARGLDRQFPAKDDIPCHRRAARWIIVQPRCHEGMATTSAAWRMLMGCVTQSRTLVFLRAEDR